MNQSIKLKDLMSNTGQIDGLPKNPRLIKDERFDKLVKSIEDDPEMLELRELLVYPHESKYVVIAGNMRLKAMQKLGYKEAICKVIPVKTDIKKIRAISIKDNVPFGDNDWDSLANDWDSEELAEWGMDIPGFDVIDEKEQTDLSENIKSEFRIEVICKDETDQEKTYNKLIEQNYECRLLTL